MNFHYCVFDLGFLFEAVTLISPLFSYAIPFKVVDLEIWVLKAIRLKAKDRKEKDFWIFLM